MIERIAVFCKNMLDWFKSDRCFVKHFIDAFSLANDLFLFTVLIFSVFFVFMYAGIAIPLGVNFLVTIIILALLTVAIVSGFFHYIKTNVDNKNNPENVSEPSLKNSMAIFYSGVGKHYLSFVGIFFLLSLFTGLLVYVTYFIAGCPIKGSGLNILRFFIPMFLHLNPADTVQGLNDVQMHGLSVWKSTFSVSSCIFDFLALLWFPEVLSKNKNVFTAFFTSVQKLLKNFLNALCVYLTIIFINNLLGVLVCIFESFHVLVFILSIGSMYWLIYKSYAIFLFYAHITKEE